MGISKKETDLLIEKMKTKYVTYAREFSPKWFNIKEFEERLDMAVKNKIDLKGFILAEIANLETIKEKYEIKYNLKKKEEKTFTELTDKKIEEYAERIKKYPEIRFHPLASFEISRFYGALSQFALYYFPVLWVILKVDLINKLHVLEDSLLYLAIPNGPKLPKRVDDHVLILLRTNVNELEIEKDKNNYLKESAFHLHDIISFIKQMLKIRDADWEKPLPLARLSVDSEKKNAISNIFSGLTGYGALLLIEEKASQIIKDFRLTAFKKSSQNY